MEEQVRKLRIAQIQVGRHEQRVENNPEEFNELVNSIGRCGLINPVVVSRDGDNYMLVAGHRRLAACKVLGHAEILCMVREQAGTLDPEITFAENFCRSQLSPVEQACAIKDCYESGAMSVGQMAKAFHRSEHWVAAQMDLVNWPKDILEAVHQKQISVAAASNLAIIEDNNYRGFLLSNAVDSGATARTTSAWLQAWRSQRSPEQALAEPPAAGSQPQQPLVPQAPCLVCGIIHRVDRLSHVPLCQGCITAIRNAGAE